ncbi:2-keto-3-deoxy-phosphogluconate aldolase [Idiomarina loihiensis]|uniref:bifunctional 4-hydroxy-2-oxoglutarate aldolase/2-dehydro-3-deoxy-phosphogluconate aldolase n=1 Tax=Idiomarina TaxID=135575 RepID=UPI000D70BF16|nr:MULTISPECIES: bifunctional 4-hydroxy-2-oxoglutarate aldolase/2-dehydro-3-deoxy-phosphogluconate aldolase [Idiomarina]PWW36948.1 2-keto-3-deoxy-phosphogluconate aldolase [Idiomarina loihiensis]TDP46756.1 2-keto-3-deoxy-phosphogluconate aldolase [Idiomarina loihiensis]TDS23027.1 2-keto-3-deoxy-phosphogluconate aldolase [Idiomarina sp. H2]
MNYSASDIFSASTIIPVIVVDDISQAVPLGKVLCEQGFKVLEVTLRTSVALEAIKKMREEIPEALIGAGTVTNPTELKQVQMAGAQFAISPGATPALLEAGKQADIPLIPGVATVSELMQGIELGYQHFKLFPAEAVGGLKLLKSIAGPFPDIRFCPTGGINESNYRDYLALDNVSCVGGSWIIPK